MDLIATFLVTDRCIASIAFHAKGDILAVASGHKVLIFVVQLIATHVDLIATFLFFFFLFFFLFQPPATINLFSLEMSTT